MSMSSYSPEDDDYMFDDSFEQAVAAFDPATHWSDEVDPILEAEREADFLREVNLAEASPDKTAS